jgi:uncharacterized membrane protein YqjE
MPAEGNDGRRGLGALLRELAEGSAQLIRGEARMARVEVSELVSGVARGTVFMATGIVLLLLGSLATLTGVVLLVGDQWLPRDLYWVGALLLVVISGALAAWLANRGRRALSPAALAPDETLDSLKEDKEWLKRRMTSGATSS